ncbi:hypothetical protein ABZP36_021396 [Zizania latifolia]
MGGDFAGESNVGMCRVTCPTQRSWVVCDHLLERRRDEHVLSFLPPRKPVVSTTTSALIRSPVLSSTRPSVQKLKNLVLLITMLSASPMSKNFSGRSPTRKAKIDREKLPSGTIPPPSVVERINQRSPSLVGCPPAHSQPSNHLAAPPNLLRNSWGFLRKGRERDAFFASHLTGGEERRFGEANRAGDPRGGLPLILSPPHLLLRIRIRSVNPQGYLPPPSNQARGALGTDPPSLACSDLDAARFGVGQVTKFSSSYIHKLLRRLYWE